MDIPTSLCSLLPNLTLEDYLRCFYLLAAASILLASSIAPLSTRFFCYGKTAQPPTNLSAAKKQTKPTSNNSNLTNLLDYLTTLTVPHSYFSHFYLVSLVSLLFWAAQFLLNGCLLRYLLSLGTRTPSIIEDRISPTQLLLTWLCLLAQSLRRYHEQLIISKSPSTSTMLLPHYLLGHAFYLTTTLSLFASYRNLLPLTTFPPPPLLKTTLSLPIFLLSSILQHKTHLYLLSLPKYSLPLKTHPLFALSLSPHYLFEILIYLSLAILSAPPHKFLNKTMLCAVLFVAANLGVSAGRTWEWYRDRFGEKAVAGRRKMIPWVY